MARFPADYKLQNFFNEQYDKEAQARLDWYFKNKRGQAQGESNNRRFGRANSASIGSGLPSINPMEFAIKKKREEEAAMQKIIIEARKQFKKEVMYPAEPRQIAKLRDGFTKEEKGRYWYLAERHQTVPEKKYTFPILSSWQYGWKLGEERLPEKTTKARTKLIRDTFYTRNGVPTLSAPALQPGIERGYTTV